MKLVTLTLSLVLGAGTIASSAAEAPPTPWSLTVERERVSLSVADGSVVALVEELGRRLGFEVIAQDVSDARVTLEFRDLPPSQAIRSICKGIGYVEVPDAASGRIARVVLTPGTNGVKNRLAARREPLPPRPDPLPDPEPPTPDEPPQPPPSSDDSSGSR